MARRCKPKQRFDEATVVFPVTPGSRGFPGTGGAIRCHWASLKR